MTATIAHAPPSRDVDVKPGRKWIGGFAALYLAVALLGAIPYFLLVVDYPGAATAADKVALVAAHYASMYTVYLATYVVFGLAVGVLALALYYRLEPRSPFTMRLATAVGLMWSLALVASGMVFTYGMTTVIDLHDVHPAQAVQTWQSVEAVAMALGGAGGELLGGLWVLLLSVVALRAGGLPRFVAWLGVLIGVVGLVSVVPPLHDAAVAFGLLQIAWFLSVGWLLLSAQPQGAAS